jgi:hypothetical protein
MNAATVSGPAAIRAASSASPLQRGQSGAAPWHSQRYGYGAGTQTTSTSQSRNMVE